ncbi:MAG TPA: Holliday junction resolvase RuvX, partial [Polymorphobacter sp.]|nr:Holliday junction resolvase RuvX [Polymorphobacter sp.]
MIYATSAEFRDALAQRGRLAGLDVGTRTIGLATCDAGWSFATPLETIARTKFTPDLAKLRSIIARERIVGLVVGLPLNMDGSDSKRTQSVREFARSID